MNSINNSYNTKNQISTYKDTYQNITDFVLQSLENGEVMWQKGWNTLGLPRNIITGNTYRGWNVFLLNFITLHHNYKTPYFLTFKQAVENGGSIKRGQKGKPIVYWASTLRKQDRETNRDDYNNEEEVSKPATYLVPKTHIVFNLDQCEGISFPEVEKCFRTHTQSIEACEQVLTHMPLKPTIEHKGDDAYYCPTQDKIVLPPKYLFKTDEAYYTTLFHELAHSTGHATRLNRKEIIASDGFGKESYSRGRTYRGTYSSLPLWHMWNSASDLAK